MEQRTIPRVESGKALVAQWLGLGVFDAEGTDASPSLGTKIPKAGQHSQKKDESYNLSVHILKASSQNFLFNITVSWKLAILIYN